jgi:hypothetical protein
VRRAELELQAGASTEEGLYARGELRYRPWENVAGLIFGQVTSRYGHSAGVGAQWRF